MPLEWDLTYRALLERSTNEEVNEELERMAGNPNFVVDGVSFLSKYKHKLGHEEDKEEETKANKYLAGITFMLCETLRMDMEAEFWGTLKDGTV